MGLEDRDYYREFVRDREKANEASFSGSGDVSGGAWLLRALLLVAVCSSVYLGVQVANLRVELQAAERVIAQQLSQMRADRERAARVARPSYPAPAERPPPIEFFNK